MLSGTATWLKQSITLYPYASLNAYGEYAWGTGVATDCRIEQYDKQMIDETGNLIYPVARITLPGTATPSMKDKVVLPNGDDKLILKIEDSTGPDGASYLKVLYV